MKHKNDEGLAKKCDISTNDPGKVCCTVRIHLSCVILHRSSKTVRSVALCLSRRCVIRAELSAPSSRCPLRLLEQQTAYFVRVFPDISMLVNGERLMNVVTSSTSRGSIGVYAEHSNMQVYISK